MFARRIQPAPARRVRSMRPDTRPASKAICGADDADGGSGEGAENAALRGGCEAENSKKGSYNAC